MKNYEQYQAEDLIVDPWFLAWVKHNHPAARQFWEQWQQQHPTHRATLLLAKDMAEALKSRPASISDEQLRVEVAQIMQLTRHLPLSPVQKTFLGRFKPSLIQLAAALIILISLGWVVWHFNTEYSGKSARSTVGHSQVIKASEWINQVNGTSQAVTITLPDRSTMVLLPHTQASYPPIFGQTRREVHLKGEAVFAVVHDSHRPFLVRSGPIITKVLGTRFRVRAVPSDSQIIVSVLSGKVSVYSPPHPSAPIHQRASNLPGVVLTANQQVIYQVEKASYQKQLVDQPRLLSPNQSEEDFVFRDTPLTDVFARIQKSYGVVILYDATLFHQCTLTASLSGVPLHGQLRLICASVNASYEVIDTQIVVTGNGCQ